MDILETKAFWLISLPIGGIVLPLVLKLSSKPQNPSNSIELITIEDFLVGPDIFVQALTFNLAIMAEKLLSLKENDQGFLWLGFSLTIIIMFLASGHALLMRFMLKGDRLRFVFSAIVPAIVLAAVIALWLPRE